MRTYLRCTIAVLVVAAIGVAGLYAGRPEPKPAPPVKVADDVKALAKANNAFALDLFAKLREERGNLFFSPFSISTALQMTYGGATGATARQMAQVMHLKLEAKKVPEAFGKLERALRRNVGRDSRFAMANGLWGQQGYPFRPAFIKLVKRDYTAECDPLDFEKSPDGSRKIINDWFTKKTRGKIRDLLAPGAIKTDTRLVLGNAIYFKGRWASKFEEEATDDEDFHLADGKVVSVPMMMQVDEFRYLKGEGFKALELPYKGKNLAMIVLLPDKKDGLAALEKGLTAEFLDKWMPRSRKTEVHVELPKFTFNSNYSLAGVLKAMGMTDAFEFGKADFSGMDGTRYLFLSTVAHQAFVEVNEKGTEAAASGVATSFGGGEEEGPEIPEFIANHPFLFMIGEKGTGSILFMGRVANPKVP